MGVCDPFFEDGKIPKTADDEYRLRFFGDVVRAEDFEGNESPHGQSSERASQGAPTELAKLPPHEIYMYRVSYKKRWKGRRKESKTKHPLNKRTKENKECGEM